jgi:condensin complex subunit 1
MSCLYALKCLNIETRLPGNSPLLQSFVNFICTNCNGNEWILVIGQLISLIYKASNHPQANAEELIKRLSDDLLLERQQSGAMTNDTLIKFLYVTGEIALNHVSFLDQVEKELKKSRQRNEKSTNSLDQVTSTLDEDIVDAIRQVKEQELLFVESSLLARIAPFVLRLAGKLSIDSDGNLYRMVLITLGKLMCISSQFCEMNLGAFLGLLENCPDAVIRGNLVIAFGDIALSFNRLADANLQFLTRRLEDANLSVKRKALLVLTHLSLTGMVKAKGKLGMVAKMLEDPNAEISHLARVFFHELAARDNTVYNNLPDIISTLSVDPQVSEDVFAQIMKHLFEYVKKERQMENLIEKLCQRFRSTDDPKHWRCFSHCLAMISFSTEKSLKTLISCAPFFMDKMIDERVFRNFGEIVSKCKKFLVNKVDSKALLDEFERKLLEASGNRGESLQNVTHELRRLSIEAKRPAQTKKKTTARKQLDWMMEETEPEDEDTETENLATNPNQAQQNATKGGDKTEKRLSNRVKNLMLEDEEESPINAT